TQTLFANMLDAGAQARDAENVWGAALQEVRKLARLRFARRIAAGTAFAPGADRGSRAHVERSGPGRSEQRFVPRKGEQVDVQRLHVDWNHAGSLGGVDQEQQVVFSSDAADGIDRLDGAEHVAGVRLGNHARLRRDGLGDIGRIDGPRAVGANARQA